MVDYYHYWCKRNKPTKKEKAKFNYMVPLKVSVSQMERPKQHLTHGFD